LPISVLFYGSSGRAQRETRSRTCCERSRSRLSRLARTPGEPAPVGPWHVACVTSRTMKNCSAGARLAALALLAIPAAVRAVDVGLKVEPALALPLSQPFGVDGTGALKGFIGLG